MLKSIEVEKMKVDNENIGTRLVKKYLILLKRTLK